LDLNVDRKLISRLVHCVPDQLLALFNFLKNEIVWN
jgi:hypothetical protein